MVPGDPGISVAAMTPAPDKASRIFVAFSCKAQASMEWTPSHARSPECVGSVLGVCLAARTVVRKPAACTRGGNPRHCGVDDIRAVNCVVNLPNGKPMIPKTMRYVTATAAGGPEVLALAI